LVSSSVASSERMGRKHSQIAKRFLKVIILVTKADISDTIAN